jgi:ABC-type transporter Mla maintaining outer membrane lipid asymmetry permease subunit MlaE
MAGVAGTAIVMAGVAGTAITADLGAPKIRDELDRSSSRAFDSIRNLGAQLFRRANPRAPIDG